MLPVQTFRKMARAMGMMMAKATWALLVVASAASEAAAAGEADPIIEKLGHGEVDWSKRVVLATGSGAPDLKLPNVAAVRLNAERVAQVAAYRNLLETLKGVRVTAKVTGADKLNDVQITSQVQGIVRGCKTVDTRYYSDGGVDIVLRCPLDGGLSAVLSPSQTQKTVSTAGPEKYTGLILDAVGTRARPALAPRVFDDAGNSIYAQEVVRPAVLRQQGVAAFVKNVEAAKMESRVGAKPLVLKVASLGETPSDVVISKSDAALLDGANLSFLAEARVVIATDGP